MKFKNRMIAGILLAEELIKYANQKNCLVLALPRGGVPVAAPVAKKLKCPLDLLLVKKIGVIGYEELALGAVAFNQPPVFNEAVVNRYPVPAEILNKIILQKQNELAERNKLYRKNKPEADVKNKIVIIVDDGIATGATMRAGILAIKNQQAQKIIVAVPVADKSICDALSEIVDEVICLYQPEFLSAVGAWYENFDQTTDEEVIALMEHPAL